MHAQNNNGALPCWPQALCNTARQQTQRVYRRKASSSSVEWPGSRELSSESASRSVKWSSCRRRRHPRHPAPLPPRAAAGWLHQAARPLQAWAGRLRASSPEPGQQSHLPGIALATDQAQSRSAVLLQHVPDGQHIRVVGPQLRLLDGQRAAQQRPPQVVAALRERGATRRGRVRPSGRAPGARAGAGMVQDITPLRALSQPHQTPTCSRWMTAMSVSVCATSGESGPQAASQMDSARSYSGSARLMSPRCTGWGQGGADDQTGHSTAGGSSQQPAAIHRPAFCHATTHCARLARTHARTHLVV